MHPGESTGDEMSTKLRDPEDMVWDNDNWDDTEDTLARTGETQRILGGGDGDEDELEREIQANLSSKVTSSLHAYKVAGVALIITLISFTINTVQ
jgi:hypothetical protein